MLRRYLPLLGVLLLACEARKPAAESATGASAADSAPTPPAPAPRLALADTTSPFLPLPTRPDSAVGLPVVRLAGQPYRVETAVRVDLTRPLLPPDSAQTSGVADSLQRAQGVGYDAVYTIQLLGAGGQPRFATTLRKADCAPAIGRQAVAGYATSAPTLLTALPAFNALAFEVPFFTPETDDISTALLLLDATTGHVRQVVPYEEWDDGDGANALTSDGRALLTGQDLLLADGRRVSLTRRGREVAATRWLNDQTLLVAYVGGYDAQGRQETLRGNNAHLLDRRGRELGAFRLADLQAEVGYTLRDEYLGQTRTYYLFDEKNQTLRLFPRAQPLRYRTLPLARLPRFAPPQRATEVHFTVYTPGGYPPVFYVDTLSGAVRYQPPRPVQ